LARWLTRDPIGNGYAFANPTSFNATDLNSYAYVRNNPMSLRDPSGLQLPGIVQEAISAARALWEATGSATPTAGRGFTNAHKVGFVAGKLGTGVDVVTNIYGVGQGIGTLIDCAACGTGAGPSCVACIVGLMSLEQFPTPGPPPECNPNEWDYTYGPLPVPCSGEPVCSEGGPTSSIPASFDSESSSE
jgi:hypothetical protein